MIRSAFISSLLLTVCLSFVAGCDGKDKPGGTNPPDDGNATAENGGGDEKKDKKHNKKDDKKDGGGDKSAELEDPTKKVCPAEVGDYPAPYFMDTVLIRLPKGVTEDNFIEYTPGVFARLSAVVDSVSCVKDVPGATISFMAMTVFEDDAAKSLTAFRDETLTAFGYNSPKFSEEKADDAKRYYEAVIDVDADEASGKPEPAKAFFVLKAGHGRMYAIVYETHPNAWNALQMTFRESAKKMSLLNP
ncbi:hypothetical protein ACNOYE_28695 [Nannocystaceae bacterium ST9]